MHFFSRQIVSDSSWPHRLQHARLPCPSPSPRVCPSSCPLHWNIYIHTHTYIYMYTRTHTHTHTHTWYHLASRQNFQSKIFHIPFCVLPFIRICFLYTLLTGICRNIIRLQCCCWSTAFTDCKSKSSSAWQLLHSFLLFWGTSVPIFFALLSRCLDLSSVFSHFATSLPKWFLGMFCFLQKPSLSTFWMWIFWEYAGPVLEVHSIRLCFLGDSPTIVARIQRSVKWNVCFYIFWYSQSR